MKNAVLIGLVWFLVIAAVTGGAAGMGHHLNAWFAGFLAIDAVSALLIGAAILHR
jgi:hypothetical protein